MEEENINTGIGDDISTIDIHVVCECGEELKIDLKGWNMEVRGRITFICPSCEGIVNTI